MAVTCTVNRFFGANAPRSIDIARTAMGTWLRSAWSKLSKHRLLRRHTIRTAHKYQACISHLLQSGGILMMLQ